jgi:hypothetical protein
MNRQRVKNQIVLKKVQVREPKTRGVKTACLRRSGFEMRRNAKIGVFRNCPFIMCQSHLLGAGFFDTGKLKIVNPVEKNRPFAAFRRIERSFSAPAIISGPPCHGERLLQGVGIALGISIDLCQRGCYRKNNFAIRDPSPNAIHVLAVNLTSRF